LYTQCGANVAGNGFGGQFCKRTTKVVWKGIILYIILTERLMYISFFEGHLKIFMLHMKKEWLFFCECLCAGVSSSPGKFQPVACLNILPEPPGASLILLVYRLRVCASAGFLPPFIFTLNHYRQTNLQLVLNNQY